MKRIAPILLSCALLAGCASNPVMTGKAEHWVGHLASELRENWGPPTKIVTQAKGIEVWEYSESGDYLSPASQNTSFRFGGFGSGGAIGGGGGISTVQNKEHVGRYQKVFRFEIKQGKVRAWYAARIEDGRVVWEDN